ncbi:protein FAR1-RELATED SEQUENCE 4-like [Eutrema salsugineum]|uniref:protein FAR1-RELATED SEQUENCE 4-like n=1 Tax=Eutrema salsugineum TaxID=72664 RepID=UPI000CED07DB|nr:protein FAR1-RELATED SEQUENCE 4-like [Eutrema salsugineum]
MERQTESYKLCLRYSRREFRASAFVFLYMLEKFNPGTTSSVEVDELGRFKYLFVTLGPTIEGFAAMKKVIIVDATLLKNGFGGCFVFATAQDPNHHHYPLSFGVVDGEKNDSWNWFFTKLKTRIPDRSELVFVFDRNVSLINAIRDVYPQAKHGYCIYHLAQNVKGNVRREKELVVGKFMEVARKYTEAEFLVAYGQLAERYPDAITYLCNSLLEEKWARCYFQGERYNINTSNCVESMNIVFDDPRKYALLPMMDAILAKLSEWCNKHRKEAATAPGAHKLVPYVKNILHGRVEIASP